MEIPENVILDNDDLIGTPGHDGFQYINQPIEDDVFENLTDVYNISTLTNKYHNKVSLGIQSESVLSWIADSPGFYKLTNVIL